MTEIWIRIYKVLKGLLKERKKGQVKCKKPGNELHKKKSASLVKEMVNDKIELNFHVVS